jgi:hypothetical protein
MQTLLLVVSLIARADAEPDSLPKGPPPRVAVVSARDLRHGAIGRERMLEPVMIEVVVVKGGRKVAQAETRMVVRTATHDVERWAEGLKVTTAGGRKLETDEVAVLLNRPRLVLISSDGKPVDPAYLKLYKPGTPVIVLPAGTRVPVARPKR